MEKLLIKSLTLYKELYYIKFALQRMELVYSKRKIK